ISFENLYPTYDIVKTFIENENNLLIDKANMIVVSPDTGAMDRAIYYSTILGLDVGLFYKRRDHSVIVKGKNPIIQHEYLGRSVENQNVLIIDDMIASGESVFEIAIELRKRKAKSIYVATTFAFFTEGVDKFKRFYDEGIINKFYSTNLNYIPQEVRDADWFHEVDMSETVANIIDNLNQDKSIAYLLDAAEGIKHILRGDVL
ncbi:MAG: phosphoribosyltransferase family protein, partial [Clostridium sp.]